MVGLGFELVWLGLVRSWWGPRSQEETVKDLTLSLQSGLGVVVYRPPSLAHPVGAALTLPAGGALAATADAITFSTSPA